MWYNGNLYWYVHNLQGDIVAIVNASGQKVEVYRYDAWGKPLPINSSGLPATYIEELSSLNPFRYRGYVWDEEAGLYYLRSRYYKPCLGRIILSDAQIETNTLLGINLYIYCKNSPIINRDESGAKSTSALVEWHTIWIYGSQSGHHYLKVGQYAFSWESSSKLHYGKEEIIDGKSKFISKYSTRKKKEIIH